MAIVLAGLPPPVLQYPVGPYYLDMAYPELMLGIEYDGREHLTPERALRDLSREGYLGRRGWDVLRFPARDVYRPGWVATQVAKKIAAIGTAAPREGLWRPSPRSHALRRPARGCETSDRRGPQVDGVGDRDAHHVEREEGQERRVAGLRGEERLAERQVDAAPPSAPTAPMSPMAAPDSRRPRRPRLVARRSAIAAAPCPRKIAGIILYVEPLPSPVSTNSTMKPGGEQRRATSLADADDDHRRWRRPWRRSSRT